MDRFSDTDSVNGPSPPVKNEVKLVDFPFADQLLKIWDAKLSCKCIRMFRSQKER